MQGRAHGKFTVLFFRVDPSAIYSWSIGHINSSVWAVLAVRAVREEKVDLRNSEQLFRVVFSTFGGQQKI